MQNEYVKFLRQLVFLSFLMIFPQLLQGQLDRDHTCKMAHAEAGAAAKKIAFQSHGMADSFDITHQRMHWEIDPDVRAISGSVRSIFRAEAGINNLYFDLHSALIVDSVKAQDSMLTFTHQANNILTIQLPNKVNTGVSDSVEVFYHGTPPATGFGSFEQTTHNGNGIVWTLSEPYGARDWWPCKQDLKDKIDSVDIFITCPAGNKAASHGTLEKIENLPNNKVRYHWKHRYPIPAYLVAMAVTNYAEFSDFANLSNGNLEILNYVFPEDSVQAVAGLGETVPVLELLDSLIGPYPYMDEKYGHAQFSWGGGMEHTTMSFMGSFNYGLVVHELAHQWFGDKVTCGSWEDIWLNEGFATYLTGVSYEHLYPTNVWDLWKRLTIASVVSQPGGSVKVDDTTNVGRIFSGRLSYDKGAMLLHMLRWKLGDADFYQALRNYLSDPDLAYGFAHTEDLKFHLEQQSGQNLDEFFDDWYHGEGYPIYSIEWERVTDSLHVKISQNTSHSSVGFFEMPVPLRFSGVAGDTTYVFDHQTNHQEFSRSIAFKADSVSFDPEQWLVARVSAIERVIGLPEEEVPAVNVFPNPAHSHINLEGCWEKLVLTDQRGRKALERFRDRRYCDAVRVELPKLAGGIYILNVDGHMQKLVLQPE